MLKKNSILLFFVLLVAGCSSYSEGQKFNVVRVFMHDPGCYSILNKNAAGEIEDISFRNWHARILDDVPKGEPMWAQIKGGKVEIHIHHASEIGGGGYQTIDTTGEVITTENHTTTPIE